MTKLDMIKALKDKAKEEDKSADDCAAMCRQIEDGPTLHKMGARRWSEKGLKHRYAANEFRKMAKQLEK